MCQVAVHQDYSFSNFLSTRLMNRGRLPKSSVFSCWTVRTSSLCVLFLWLIDLTCTQWWLMRILKCGQWWRLVITSPRKPARQRLPWRRSHGNREWKNEQDHGLTLVCSASQPPSFSLGERAQSESSTADGSVQSDPFILKCVWIPSSVEIQTVS